ncbi:c-type cytochrome [Parasulfitobacter algicola]|uniref:Cytochrome c n=1 Tax=Parasulfitobacter algicola TaxID=2614809 RepID=A0ABX2IKB6_9RHOB|nr:cytochrome c [Sulfitobacter algicola]NSX53327.1 cytochrome c [Sulfitobacter algicola]
MKLIYAAAAILAVGAVGYAFWPSSEPTSQSGPTASNGDTALAEVVLPDTFSENAQVGQLVFDAKCAACHGTNAVGQDGVAPPLVHKIYEPSHHGDESFQRAAAMGVRAHHWPFGDMPPVEGITRGDVTMIIAYIRELQGANGIN